MSAHLRAQNDKVTLGLWLYLMTDLMVFAALFATYIVLKPGQNGGVGPSDIYNLPYALLQTVILLVSSATAGVGYLLAQYGHRRSFIILMTMTIALGVGFVGMEFHEFRTLVQEGHSWQASGFLTGFFSLVATHGLHICIGIIWALVLLVFTLKRGFTQHALRKLGLFTIFWHFLDFVWIFIFSIVYVLGVL